MIQTFTHADLVKRAAGWLRNRKNCRFVVCEQTCQELEIADAIGFKCGNHSYLVECKVSRADFLADRDKPFRKEPTQGMGMMRYFLAPAGLISPDEIPPRWGLLEASGRSIRLVREAEWQERNLSAELSLVVQALSMAQANLSEPLHDWLTGPNSSYAKMRAHARAHREDEKKRTCAHRTILTREQWEKSGGPRVVYCTNYPASKYSYCGEHGGKTRRTPAVTVVDAPASAHNVTA